MPSRSARFQGLGTILLQPYDEDLDYGFEFEIASAVDANDGAIPFGETLAGTPAGSYCEIRKHPERTDYTVEILGTITTYAITGVNIVAETFAIAGDYTSVFTAGKIFIIEGSTGNDGTWVVTSSSHLAGTTTIIVTGDITDATVDGDIIANSVIVSNTNTVVTIPMSYPYVTTLNGADPATTTIIVNSTSGMSAGDRVGIKLDSGAIHWTTIDSISTTNTTTFVVAAILPGAAANGNKVFVPRIVRGKYHLTIACYFSGGGDREFNFNRVSVRDI